MAIPDAPQTRTEQYLAKAAGQNVNIPSAPQTRMEQYLEAIANNGGSTGSGVLVAHATVDFSDIMGMLEDPETPLNIEIDKTFAELAAADMSLLILEVTEEGESPAFFVFAIDGGSTGENMLYYWGAETLSMGLLRGSGYQVAAMVGLDGGDTVAALIPIPDASSGNEPFVIATTTADQDQLVGGQNVTVSLSKTYAELSDADYSVVKMTLTENGASTGLVVVLHLSADMEGEFVYSAIADGMLFEVIVSSTGAHASAAALAS